MIIAAKNLNEYINILEKEEKENRLKWIEREFTHDETADERLKELLKTHYNALLPRV